MKPAGAGSNNAPVWDVTQLGMMSLGSSARSDDAANAAKKKTAEEFLGQNANLVNLNDLISRPPPSSTYFLSRTHI